MAIPDELKARQVRQHQVGCLSVLNVCLYLIFVFLVWCCMLLVKYKKEILIVNANMQ